MNLRTAVAYVALAIVAIAAARDLLRLDHPPWAVMYDFTDFYCAGDALDRGSSPYTYEPLHTCEQRFGDAARRRYTVPAPLPPYDFPILMILARLAFYQARIVAAIAIAAAVLASAAGLWRLRIPLDIAVLSLALSAGYVELTAGQIVPFALMFLVLCGVALARGRDTIAGVLAALTTIEPHLGVGVALAVFAFVPRARLALAVTSAMLAAIAVSVAGWNGPWQYATGVVPAQAAAETAYPYQYSLSYALAYAGAAPRAALIAGSVALAVFLGVGLWLAPRTAKALGRRELLAFLPAAFTVMPGSYVHQVELCFAIPAMLTLVTTFTGRLKTIGAIALCALAVPWIAVWTTKKLLLASIFVCAAILLHLDIAVVPAFSALAALAATMYAFEIFPPHAAAAVALTKSYSPNDFVQVQWTDVAQQLSTHDFGWFAIKLPTWAALAALAMLALRVARGAIRQR